MNSAVLCYPKRVKKQMTFTQQNNSSRVDPLKRGTYFMGSTVGKERVGFVADDERSLILQMLKGERRRQTAAAMMELFCESVLSAPLSRGERMEGQGVDNCGKIQKHACSNLHRVLIPHYICLSSYITSGLKGTHL